MSEARRGTAIIYSKIGRVRGREAPGRGPEAPRAAGERCAGAPYAVLDVVLARDFITENRMKNQNAWNLGTKELEYSLGLISKEWDQVWN